MNANDLNNLEPNGNLWVHPDYNGGPLGLITVHCTYYNTTLFCMDAFLNGGHDSTFRLLASAFGGRDRMRREYIAITNYPEKVYPTNKRKRPAPDYIDSRIPYGDRIARLEPVSHLIVMGNGFNDLAVEIARERSPDAVILEPGHHPFYAHFNLAYREELARRVQVFRETIHRYE